MSQSLDPGNREFTLNEIRRYDGEDGPMLVAFRGKVFDVTSCPHWRSGIHENLHFPAQDLTSEFPQAPHGEEVFTRPCVRMVGYLVDPAPE